MTFPEYVPTRQVTVGGAMGLESSRLLMIRVTTAASKSLIWDESGYRFVKWSLVEQSGLGTEVSMLLPRTDVAGWKDGLSGALIDVSAENSYTHQYTTLVEFLDDSGRPVGISPITLGPYVVPDGDGPIDLDKTVPASTVAGGLINVPDSWGTLVAAAEAAAAEAAANLAAGSAVFASLAQGEKADAALPAAQKAAAGGVAPLDGGSRVPQVNLPEHLTPANLEGTFVPVALGRPGNRLVTLGDSITQAQFDYANRVMGSGWPLYAQIYSQGRLHLVNNAGVAGNKTSQMLARFDTDVTPYAPNIVVVLAGTNDIGATPTQTPFASWKADMQSIVGRIRAIGAAPVLATIPPRDSGGFNSDIVLWNAWLRDFAARNGISVLDFSRALTDPSNGHYIAAYTSDGIHPSKAGDAILGEVAAWVLSELTPVGSPMLPVDSTDTNNLLGSAGLFLTASGGVGTGWTPGSAPTGVTKSVVADAGIKGQFQKIAMVAASGLWVQSRNLAAGWAAGDKLRFVGVLDSDGGTNAQATGKLIFNGASAGARPFNDLTARIVRGVWCQTVTVPAGTTSITAQLECGGSGATGVVQFAQVGVYNLTQMGLAA